MSDAAPAAPAEEPSIEEILASIRKIISDEPGAEGEAAAPLGDLPLPETANNYAATANDDNEDDALDLGAYLEEDVAVTDPAPPASDETADDWNLDMEDLANAHAAEPPVSLAIPMSSAIDSDLISAPAAAAATAAMARLTEAATPKAMQIIGGNPLVTARTMEDVVEDLLRPLLRDWLDQNLPHLVERLVEKELARMSRRAQDD